MAKRDQNGLTPQMTRELRKAGIEPLGIGEDSAEPEEWNPLAAVIILIGALIGLFLAGWGLSLLLREGFAVLYEGVQSFIGPRVDA